MEDIIEKAQFCLNCKVKPCKKGCPMENDIPSFIQCIKKEEYYYSPGSFKAFS